MDGACRLRHTERVICHSCCCDACSHLAVGHLLTSISADHSPYILELTVMRSRHRISEPSCDLLYYYIGGVAEANTSVGIFLFEDFQECDARRATSSGMQNPPSMSTKFLLGAASQYRRACKGYHSVSDYDM
ncbi:hypothetical protein PROFUN_14491 [Planoprotostelium fungivorum]|uniref:Uncharacterized protein n=1 Tax=Planoprotostelium fungivorum TaxID=1890364 RepID=A0A2P6MZF8_9EUKA|nr:hypothetical protein PROFUN_14491 [Planoprotostelium fungivorum]